MIVNKRHLTDISILDLREVPPINSRLFASIRGCLLVVRVHSRSEFLAHLHVMNRAFCRQHARIQLKARHLEHAEVQLRVSAHKRLKCLVGNAFRTPDGDMRMKGFKIRFEPRMKDRVLNASMQRKEMRMPFPYTRPDDRWAAAGVEGTDAAYWQKKWRHAHLAQSFAQPFLCRRSHVTEKAKRQMKLFLGKPAQAG
jgi:hypothetical protein